MSFFKKLFGGTSTSSTKISKRANQPDVFHVANDEQRMNAAMDKARLTLQYFTRSLLNPAPEQQYFSLKAKIEDGSKVEHIWLTDVSVDDSGNFFGKIGNEPLNLTNVKLGQKVGIPSANVSDWMIVENGKLIGGYTIRALRNQMTENERKAFDLSMGLYVDEGVDYYPHDFTTPEGAILCLEDAYDAQDLDLAIACKDFNEEAKLMLSKNEKMKSLSENKEMVDKMEEILKLSFIKHMDGNFPSFKGVKRAFPETYYINEDMAIVTEVCFNTDKTKTTQRLYVSKASGEWKVLSLAD